MGLLLCFLPNCQCLFTEGRLPYLPIIFILPPELLKLPQNLRMSEMKSVQFLQKHDSVSTEVVLNQLGVDKKAVPRA